MDAAKQILGAPDQFFHVPYGTIPAMTPQTLPDVTPGGATTPITTDPNIMATWVTVTAPTTNAADLRVGDANTGANRGAAIPPGKSFTFERGSFTQGMYLLKSINVYGTSTDKAATTYGT